MRRFLPALLCSVALVGLASGCGSDGPGHSNPSANEVRAAIKGAPAPLSALHDQANEMLDGGARAFNARIAELKGYPVVVNKWGSWCGPCIEEMPHFQQQALKHAKRVAFLGVDVEESKEQATKLLDQIPLTYPSFWDPRLNVSAEFNAVAATPATAFYDSNGKLAYVHQGPYLEEQDLAADIKRYAR